MSMRFGELEKDWKGRGHGSISRFLYRDWGNERNLSQITIVPTDI